jgi:hypothetical protein
MHVRHTRLLLTLNKSAFAVCKEPSLRPFKESSKLRPSTILQFVRSGRGRMKGCSQMEKGV